MTRVYGAHQPPALRRLRACLSLIAFFFIFILAARIAPAQETDATLTNCSQVLALPAERASQGLRVTVTGVVTSADPTWGGKFFVQDATGGVFVDKRADYVPKVGDLVTVSGVSHRGSFAPTITKPTWRAVGTAPMPAAKIVPIEQLMAGVEDSQRVEVVGIVRAVELQTNRLGITLASGGYTFRLFTPILPDVDPQTLVGATARVRGTAAPSFNAELRHLISVIMFVPAVSDFIVEKRELTDPFTEPVLPLNNIGQYRNNSELGQRVHVKGIVTYQRPGQDLFLKDSTGGLHVKCTQLSSFAMGEIIEAVGFPDLENFLPVLQNANCRRTGEPRQMIAAEPVSIDKLQAGLHHADPVSIDKLQAGLHHADFIVLQGNVLDRNIRHVRHVANGKEWIKTVLLLQSENLSFTAEAETPEEDPNLSSIPIGSRIEVSGVSMTESGADGRFKSLQVLLPALGNIRILSKPSWLTPARLGIALGIFFVVSVLAVSWTIVISHKNSELNLLIREKEKAKTELQNAHDQLEARVKERTEQLKIQIAARKESELQFKGGLAERTRLAQELHDTLEQTLASIALQLDTSAKLFGKDAEVSGYHLELARNILAQSQMDVRRSVWDLRSRALEQFDLRGALVTSSKQITDGTGINVAVSARGRVRPLPEIIEDNLLRIAQEALTNSIKHSGATRVELKLDYGPQNVVLEIEDDGKGFAVADCAGPREGHFGLLGISERTQRLNGRLVITSAPDSGTTVRVEIPIAAAQEIKWTETSGLRG